MNKEKCKLNAICFDFDDLTNKNLWRVRKKLIRIVKMKMMLVFCQKRKLDRR